MLTRKDIGVKCDCDCGEMGGVSAECEVVQEEAGHRVYYETPDLLNLPEIRATLTASRTRGRPAYRTPQGTA